MSSTADNEFLSVSNPAQVRLGKTNMGQLNVDRTLKDLSNSLPLAKMGIMVQDC